MYSYNHCVAKKKSAFIDGSLARASDSHHSFMIWSRCNSMVKSWILTSASKLIYKIILRFNDAFEIWNDLSARFHITNLPRSYQLSLGFSLCLSSCPSISSYSGLISDSSQLLRGLRLSRSIFSCLPELASLRGLGYFRPNHIVDRNWVQLIWYPWILQKVYVVCPV